MGGSCKASTNGSRAEIRADPHDAEHAAGEHGAIPVLCHLLHGRQQCELRVLLPRRALHHPGGGAGHGTRGSVGNAPQRERRGLRGKHPQELLAPAGLPDQLPKHEWSSL